jgi:hypothetical protein
VVEDLELVTGSSRIRATADDPHYDWVERYTRDRQLTQADRERIHQSRLRPKR